MAQHLRFGFACRRVRRLSMALTALAVLLLAGCGTISAARPAPGETHPLSSLRFRSGWLHLVLLDLESQQFMTNVTWEVARRRSVHPDALPRPGDVLRITTEDEVEIVDYQERGEADYLVSPGSRRRRRADLTGVKLPPATEVVVLEIFRDKPIGPTQSIWARVGIP